MVHPSQGLTTINATPMVNSARMVPATHATALRPSSNTGPMMGMRRKKPTSQLKMPLMPHTISNHPNTRNDHRSHFCPHRSWSMTTSGSNCLSLKRKKVNQ